ncbi:AAC(3) family N-acetyltransferase [Campylobacter sp. RKI_CA19_01121]|uniref:AAC(3) family N-acetyltransferase n=1 Tax=Campylobacter sp. RKI_CA19_01121 TaxID=2911626 RepID=UPI0021E95427|nr:AAC(3) family N-acetyltransferase [Campylobacter sp. RKI_CA19_01121]MCV3336731.1 AAC(3) family N-acetyltransferase [Campylobacter sp. RKI_CA19_01121]
MQLLQSKNKIIKRKDLIDTLRNKVGIQHGDTICIHSSLLHLGTPLLPKDMFLKTIIESFYDAVGKKGTMIMPTFTYSFCKNQVYNKLQSKSTMGALSEFFRTQENVTRTNDPIFSFAIKGERKQYFLKNTTSCFGENSVYDMLAKENGKIILFGTEESGYTFSHFIEEKIQVPYRYYKTFSGKIIDENNQSYNRDIKYYVRDTSKNKSKLLLYNQIALLQLTNNFKKITFANSHIISINAKQWLDDFSSLIQKDYYILVRELI